MDPKDFNDAPPGADELDVGLAGLLGAPPPALVAPAVAAAPITPAAAPAAPRSVPRGLTDAKRQRVVELEHPFELDGVEYRAITIRRMTAGEVADFVAKLNADPSVTRRYPLYYVGDAEIPDAAWDAMDDDDRLAVTTVGSDFLPARFRAPTDA